MKKAAFHSSGRLDIDMYLNRFRIQRFVFTADGSSFDITGFTWNLTIKENVGSLQNLLSYGLGTGLSFPVYEENVLEARFLAADVTKTSMLGEGKKYWELVRTDTNEIWLSGEANFQYGLLDSGGSDQDVTVNISNETISIELQAIVNVSGSGGGGMTNVTDFNMTSSLPSSPTVGERRRIVLSPPYTPVIIGNVAYNHFQIIEYTLDGYWIAYQNNTSDQ